MSGACNTGTSEGWSVIAELPANSTTYRYSIVESCGYAAYEYFVIATKDGGGSDPSNTIPAR